MGAPQTRGPGRLFLADSASPGPAWNLDVVQRRPMRLPSTTMMMVWRTGPRGEGVREWCVTHCHFKVGQITCVGTWAHSQCLVGTLPFGVCLVLFSEHVNPLPLPFCWTALIL